MNRRLYRLLLPVLILTSGALSAQSWTQKTNMPGNVRDAAIAFTIGDRIYMGGGISAKDFYEYNTTTGTWTRKADIPGVTAERAFGAGFSIGEKGYVGFGYDGNTNILRDLWEYDPSSNSWTRKADFPGTARDGVTSFVVGSKAYVGGGSDNKILFSDFYEYDPSSNSWTKKGDLPTGAAIFQASFTIGSYAYIATGSVGFLEPPETYRYNPADDTWDQMADFAGAPRQAAVGFAVNGKGYIGLGQTRYSSAFSDFYSYDPVKNEWAPAGSFPQGTGRAWATASAVDGKAYIGTGWDLASTFFKDWWEINVTAAGVGGGMREMRDLLITPNPSRGSLEVTIPDGDGIGTMSLVDAMGHRVMAQELEAGRVRATLDLSALPAGVYLLRVQRGGVMKVEKIVKE